MKTLAILILSIIFTIGCGSDDGNDIILTDPTPPIVVTPTDPGTNNTILLTLQAGGKISLYDGETAFIWKLENSVKAGNKLYSHENILYSLDDYGETSQTWNIIIQPDLIALNGTDKWIIDNMSPEESSAAGGLYKDYTKIYLNSDEYGSWATRQYKTESIIILNDDVFIKSTTGSWYHVNGSKEDIRFVNNEFVIWDYNSSGRTAKINDVSVSWSTNYFNTASHWIKSGSTWYSQNGYSWDGEILIESGSSMADWRVGPYDTGYNESPVIIAAGSNYENSETVIYFLECNSGYLIKYIPSTDQNSLASRLYTGDGYRTTGLYYQTLLNAVTISGNLYFLFEANYYKHNYTSTLTGHFISGVSQILEY